MAGYSGTPLAKKLGYKPGQAVHLQSPPRDYRAALALADPDSFTWLKQPSAGVQLVHAFVTEEKELQRLLYRYRQRIAADGMIWISWPKRAAKVPTDITEDRVRAVALPLGLVDIKVCAVDAVWSALKLVIRKELR